MSFIKKKYRIEPARKSLLDCECNKCEVYRKQVLVDLSIVKTIIELNY
jgi:hypothetical protein